MRGLLASFWLGAYRLSVRVKARLFALGCGGAFHQFGRHSVLQLPVRVFGESRIAIGADVFVGANCWFNADASGPVRDGPIISIGDGVSITGFCTVSAAENVIIESNVLIARYVYISDHVHAHADQDVPVLRQGLTGIAPVRIGTGSWLGQGVVICPGVTVGRGAVIGANSVVRHDVPEFTVVGGVPAQVIRRTNEGQRPR